MCLTWYGRYVLHDIYIYIWLHGKNLHIWNSIIFCEIWSFSFLAQILYLSSWEKSNICCVNTTWTNEAYFWHVFIIFQNEANIHQKRIVFNRVEKLLHLGFQIIYLRIIIHLIINNMEVHKWIHYTCCFCKIYLFINIMVNAI